MRKLFIFIFLYSNIVVGQQITFNVQSNFGYKFLKLTNILPTDSCYYATGVITDTSGQQAQTGSLFLKFSLTGDTLLTKKLVVPSKHYYTWNTGFFTTQDGNLATAGESADSIGKVFFLKYSSQGDTLFIKEYLNPNYPMETLITADNLNQYGGGYYLSGIYLLSEDIPQPNIVVLKLDESGNLVQQKTYGNNTTEMVGSTLAEPDGGLIVGAWRTNYNYVLKNFLSRAYIFKVDSLGTVEWEYQSPSGQLWDMAKSMVKTLDGGLVVASGKGIEQAVNASQGVLKWNPYFFKLNANHQFVWGREIRGERYSSSSKPAKIYALSDGSGFVAAGRIVEDKSYIEPRLGSYIVKLSNHGDSLWTRYYTVFADVPRYPEPVDFKPTPDGGYLIAGQTEEGLETFGWLMKLDSFGCLVPGCNANDGPNAATEQLQDLRLAIYPNPTTDFLNFELRTPQLLPAASFRILDSSGQAVKEIASNYPRDTFIVPVREWAAGAYFLQYVEGGEVRATERFMVVKK